MRRLIKQISRLLRQRDGNAVLEFAIGSGVLVSVFAGTFQFGYTFLMYNNLENAVIRGAHYAALVPYDSASTSPSSSFQTSVQNMVVYGSPSGGTTPVVPGLATSNVNLTVTFTNNVPALMTVSISNFALNSIFSSVTLTNKPQVSYPYQGVWSPL